MADPTDLAPQIEAAVVAGVQSVTVDGQTVTQIPVQDQIAADRYLASKAAVKNRNRGFRLAKIIPPGAG
jgi:ABC-type sugar transport system substrate-binding protein